jgi:hypothetical protein
MCTWGMNTSEGTLKTSLDIRLRVKYSNILYWRSLSREVLEEEDRLLKYSHDVLHMFIHIFYKLHMFCLSYCKSI